MGTRYSAQLTPATRSPFAFFDSVTLTFWPNIHWWTRYRDGISLCQVWRFWFKPFWFLSCGQTDRHTDRITDDRYTDATTHWASVMTVMTVMLMTMTSTHCCREAVVNRRRRWRHTGDHVTCDVIRRCPPPYRSSSRTRAARSRCQTRTSCTARTPEVRTTTFYIVTPTTSIDQNHRTTTTTL